jgi:alanine racemase
MISKFQNRCSTLLVDLTKVRQNYDVAKKKMGPHTDCSAVVKANAYGLGSVQISQALYGAGCRNFFTAYLEEALKIKPFLLDADIYILNGLEKNEYEECYINKFIPVLNSISDIEDYNSFARKKIDKSKVTIHLDTGMARLGLESSEFRLLSDKPEMCSNLDITYVMSHLTSAEIKDSTHNIIQLNKLKEFIKNIPNVKVSLANSSGIFLGNEYHLNLIRPGCMLYGVNPTPYAKSSPVVQVVTLYGKVLQIRKLDVDQTVSYGSRYRANKGDKVATIACGYADGYKRAMNDRIFCYFQGCRLPIIGTITMDMVMVDVNSLSDRQLDALDYVELLGNNVTVDMMAESADTIGYEILTSIGSGNRLNRLYV